MVVDPAPKLSMEKRGGGRRGDVCPPTYCALQNIIVKIVVDPAPSFTIISIPEGRPKGGGVIGEPSRNLWFRRGSLK